MNPEEIAEWCKKNDLEHYKKYESYFVDKLDQYYLSEFFSHLLGGRPFFEAFEDLKLNHPDTYKRHKKSLDRLYDGFRRDEMPPFERWNAV
tara:strand:- start:203 stop:475 length:273 start_codon:yes stop_codon:yes gene_type:complete